MKAKAKKSKYKKVYIGDDPREGRTHAHLDAKGIIRLIKTASGEVCEEFEVYNDYGFYCLFKKGRKFKSVKQIRSEQKAKDKKLKTKHTKGPWVIGEITTQVFFDGAKTLQDKEGMAHAILLGGKKTQEANARLISACPEMLEALEHCIAFFESKRPNGCGVDDNRDCSPYNDAIEAIKKAKGE